MNLTNQRAVRDLGPAETRGRRESWDVLAEKFPQYPRRPILLLFAREGGVVSARAGPAGLNGLFYAPCNLFSIGTRILKACHALRLLQSE